MRKIVYFSPVRWQSPKQRPHHFVEWAAREMNAQILWVEPFPVRLPQVRDLSFHASRGSNGNLALVPSWLRILRPRFFPVEPIPFLREINRWRVENLLADLRLFLGHSADAWVIVGKPSLLARESVERLGVRSVYDAMDAFPAFYSGISRSHMQRVEEQIARQVSTIWVTSPALIERWISVRPDLRHVPNGVSVSSGTNSCIAASSHDGPLGYVGTMGGWFDWNWLVTAAESLPSRRIELIGFASRRSRPRLPANVDFLGERSHEWSMRRMSSWSVGLIPFIHDELTRAVDPVKFYEYRAAGLPVVSTSFGSMAGRSREDGVVLVDDPRALPEILALIDVLAMTSAETADFVRANSWQSRFDGLL